MTCRISGPPHHSHESPSSLVPLRHSLVLDKLARKTKGLRMRELSRHRAIDNVQSETIIQDARLVIAELVPLLVPHVTEGLLMKGHKVWPNSCWVFAKFRRWMLSVGA